MGTLQESSFIAGEARNQLEKEVAALRRERDSLFDGSLGSLAGNASVRSHSPEHCKNNTIQRTSHSLTVDSLTISSMHNELLGIHYDVSELHLHQAAGEVNSSNSLLNLQLDSSRTPQHSRQSVVQPYLESTIASTSTTDINHSSSIIAIHPKLDGLLKVDDLVVGVSGFGGVGTGLGLELDVEVGGSDNIFDDSTYSMCIPEADFRPGCTIGADPGNHSISKSSSLTKPVIYSDDRDNSAYVEQVP